MKQVIRLTESDLHNLVKESVKRIIREWDSPLDRIRNNKPKVVGKINNFDPNRSHTQLNGMYADNQRIMDIAKKRFISIISKPFKVSVSNYDADAYGYFYTSTPDGWSFEVEDIPVDLVIDDYSYDEPPSWDSPGGYSDTEGHVEGIDMPEYVYFCPPGDGSEWQRLQFDDTIKELFIKNARDDGDLSDALHDREDYERDMEAGRYDEYINNQIDMMRGN